MRTGALGESAPPRRPPPTTPLAPCGLPRHLARLKPIENRQLIADIWSRLRPYRGWLAASFVALLIAVPVGQLHPLFWKYVVDTVLPEKDVTALLVVLVLMVLSYLIAGAAGALQDFFLEKAGQGLVRDVRVEAYEKLGNQSMRYHHNRRTGDLVTRVISDVDSMETSVLRNISGLIQEIFTFLIVASIVIALQPVIGGFIMLPLMLAFILVKKFNREVKGVYEALRTRLGEIGTFVNDRLGGVQLTQSYGRQRSETHRFRDVVGNHYESAMAAIRLRALFFPLVGLGGFLSNVVMLGLGAWFIWRGEFTLGGLIAYRGYWWRLQSPVNTLARMTDTLQRARAAATRVFGVLYEPIDIVDAPNAQPWRDPRGEITFEHAGFRYDEGPVILEDIHLTIHAGEFVAIAGSSGAGKSTLLNLVPRFFDPTEGAVRLDGHDLRELTLESVRDQLGLVQQETYLFNDTILENIRYARPDRSREQAIEAAHRANAHVFIEQLANQYDTIVGERGVKLSGGQKQRISLARAFLANPLLLLLDEPTSSVEPESEELIANSITDLARERTTLLVTHRVSLLKRAPRILFFKHHRIIADGSHDTLMEVCEAYRQSYSIWEAEEFT